MKRKSLLIGGIILFALAIVLVSALTDIDDTLIETTGNLLASNFNVTSERTFVGWSAGLDSSGSDNTFIGLRAGKDSLGTTNILIGKDAGQSNEGNYSIGLGWDTLYSNTGNNVVAIGRMAGYFNTGSDVVAIGYQAGNNNALSDQFILRQANVNEIPLIQGNFSSGNVGIGTISPLARLHVSGNILANNFNVTTARTFVGIDAGLGNPGEYNIFIGNAAGESSTGNHSIGIGREALFLNDRNGVVAIGYRAGHGNEGDNVVAIGWGAGYENQGDNVVAIGYQAGISSAVSDQFILQQQHINDMPLIQGNFSSGYVGINTTSPQNMLNVIGTVNATTGFIVGANTGYTGTCVNVTYLGGIAISCND